MKTIEVKDSIGISSRSVTDEGFLVAKGIISRVGTQTYLASELGLDGDPIRKVVLYRPASEVFDQSSIDSFNGNPLTNNHPPVLVTKDNWKEYSHGDVRGVAKASDSHVGAEIVFKTPEIIGALDSGKCELSNGYKFNLDMTAGVSPNGEAYDGIQRQIRGNHVALVDKARCGSACRVHDNAPAGNNKEIPMTDRKIVVDGIPLEVSETTAGVIEKLAKDRDEALKMATDADSKVEELNATHKAETEALVAEHTAQVDELKKDVITPEIRDSLIPAWAAMIETVKKHSTVATDGKTCTQIRREFVEQIAVDAEKSAVVAPVLAGKSVADASDEAISIAFGVLAISLDSKKESANGEKAVGDALAGVVKSAPAISARDLFIQNQSAR